MAKEIKTIEVSLDQIKFGLENPRKKLTKKKKEEIKASLKEHGDFGVFVIDENYNMVSGHQRFEALNEIGSADKILCKMLVGYSQSEVRAINIKANTHVGEWDIDMLARWTADMQNNLDFNIPEIDVDNRKINDMEPIRYEKYDYVMIVCNNEVDYLNLTRKLGLEDKKVVVSHSEKSKKTRKIKARAIMYNDFVTKMNESNE